MGPESSLKIVGLAEGVGVSVGVVVRSPSGVDGSTVGEWVNIAIAVCVSSSSLKTGAVTVNVAVSGVPVPGAISGDRVPSGVTVPVVGTTVPGVPVTSAVGETNGVFVAVGG